MSLRTALSAFAGRGAAENARRSLAEWDRAQAEVSALLERIGERDGRAATRAADTSAGGRRRPVPRRAPATPTPPSPAAPP